jgi:hypothetical protein
VDFRAVSFRVESGGTEDITRWPHYIEKDKNDWPTLVGLQPMDHLPDEIMDQVCAPCAAGRQDTHEAGGGVSRALSEMSF